MTTTEQTLENRKLDALLAQLLQDLGGAFCVPLVRMGETLGLYRTLHASGPMASAALAEATGLAERYVREWLSAQAAANYVTYDASSNKFSLTPEQAAVF